MKKKANLLIIIMAIMMLIIFSGTIFSVLYEFDKCMKVEEVTSE